MVIKKVIFRTYQINCTYEFTEIVKVDQILVKPFPDQIATLSQFWALTHPNLQQGQTVFSLMFSQVCQTCSHRRQHI